MTKVYLVYCKRIESDIFVVCEVFTNKRKAKAFVEYWNKAIQKHHYWLEESPISQIDYSKLPF